MVDPEFAAKLVASEQAWRSVVTKARNHPACPATLCWIPAHTAPHRGRVLGPASGVAVRNTLCMLARNDDAGVPCLCPEDARRAGAFEGPGAGCSKP